MVKTVKSIANRPLGEGVEPKSRRCSFLRAAKTISLKEANSKRKIVQKQTKEIKAR